MVVHSRFAPTLSEVLADLPGLALVLQVADESGHDLLPGAQWYENALAAASDQRPAWADDWSPDDLYILYTGGTTGLPKGVLWRQADIHRTSMGGRDGATRQPFPTVDAAAEAAADGSQVVCPAAPFMHGAGHWVAFMGMNQGGTVVVQDVVDRLDPADLCSVIERERVQFLQIVGDAFGRPIVEEMATGRHDVSSLAIVLSGGAALSAPVKARFLDLLPDAMLIDGLGSSEGGGQGMQVTVRDMTASTGTFTPTEGSIVVSEDLTEVLAPGHDGIGWLAKAGGDVPLGYLGDPDKTARTFPVIAGERMSVPGDRARHREDGSIELLGRDSVTINSGGEKIFAEEVEAAVVAHPDVDDVVVTSRPSERWGQEVVAVVQLRPGADATEEDLAAEAARHIARYKLPKAWVVVDADRALAGRQGRLPLGGVDGCRPLIDRSSALLDDEGGRGAADATVGVEEVGGVEAGADGLHDGLGAKPDPSAHGLPGQVQGLLGVAERPLGERQLSAHRRLAVVSGDGGELVAPQLGALHDRQRQADPGMHSPIALDALEIDDEAGAVEALPADGLGRLAVGLVQRRCHGRVEGARVVERLRRQLQLSLADDDRPRRRHRTSVTGEHGVLALDPPTTDELAALEIEGRHRHGRQEVHRQPGQGVLRR